MLMKNISGEELLVPTAMLLDAEAYTTQFVLIPKDEVFDAKLGYCVPGILKNGARAPSLIEQATVKGEVLRRVMPADPEVAELWKKTPTSQWRAGKPDPYRTASESTAPQIYKGKRGVKAKPIQLEE